MKINKTVRVAAWMAAVFALSGTWLPAGARREAPASRVGEPQPRARYYFLQGAERQSQGLDAEAHEYFKRASAIDPSYAEAVSAYGRSRLMINSDTLQSPAELHKSLGLMRAVVDRYPADSYEAQYYAYVATTLGEADEVIRVLERTDSLRPDRSASLLYLADAYRVKGKFDKAIDILGRYETREGVSPQLTLKKTQLYLAKADTAGALRQLDLLMASNPSDPTYVVMKGNMLEYLQLPDSVEYYYHLADKVSPGSGQARLALANLYKSRGDSTAYDQAMYDALLSEDFSVEDKGGMLAEYLQLLFTGHYDTARGDHLFEVLREQYPHEPLVLDLDARYSAAKGELDDAVEKISYAIDLSPDTQKYYSQLMTYEMAADRPLMAMEAYDRAAGRFAPDRNLKFIYATAASTAGETEKAASMYDSLIKDIDPRFAASDTLASAPRSLLTPVSYENLVALNSLYTMLGDAYMGAHDSANAFRSYQNAMYFYGSSANTLNNYAYFLALESGDLGEALKMSREAVELVPDSEVYLDTLAWILFLQGQYQEALDVQTKAISLIEEGKESAEFFDHYGDILYFNGQPDEAVEAWKKAMSLDPKNSVVVRKVKQRKYINETK